MSSSSASRPSPPRPPPPSSSSSSLADDLSANLQSKASLVDPLPVFCQPVAEGDAARSKKKKEYQKKRDRQKLESKMRHRGQNFVRSGSCGLCNCGAGECKFEYKLPNCLLADIDREHGSRPKGNVTVRLQDCRHGVEAELGAVRRSAFKVCTTCAGKIVDNLNCLPRDAVTMAVSAIVSNFPDFKDNSWEYSLVEVNASPSLWTLTLRGWPKSLFEPQKVELHVDHLKTEVKLYWDDHSELFQLVLQDALNLLKGPDLLLGHPFRVESFNFGPSSPPGSSKQVVITSRAAVPFDHVAKHDHSEHDDPSKVQYFIGKEDPEDGFAFTCVKEDDIVFEESGEEGKVAVTVNGFPICVYMARVSSLMEFVKTTVCEALLGTYRLSSYTLTEDDPLIPEGWTAAQTKELVLSMIEGLCSGVFRLEVNNFFLFEDGIREVAITTRVTVPPQYKDHDHKKGHNDPSIPFFLRLDDVEFSVDDDGDMTIADMCITCAAGDDEGGNRRASVRFRE